MLTNLVKLKVEESTVKFAEILTLRNLTALVAAEITRVGKTPQSDFPNLRKLHVHVDLQPKIAQLIANWPSLTSLLLPPGTNISFDNLTNLRQLMHTSRSFKKIPAALSRLEVLYCDHLPVLEAMSALPCLKTLRYSSVSSSDLPLLRHMTQIQDLGYLSFSDISEISSRPEFRRLTRLESDDSHDLYQSSPDGSVFDPSTLTYLDTRQASDLLLLSKLTSLRGLVIQGSVGEIMGGREEGEAVVDGISRLTNLVLFWAEATEIPDYVVECLPKLTCLTRLGGPRTTPGKFEIREKIVTREEEEELSLEDDLWVDEEEEEEEEWEEEWEEDIDMGE
jgi:hypothetical protein